MDDVLLRGIVARLTKRPASEIQLNRWPTDYGLDSLSLLLFREQCERAFGVYFGDAEWATLRTLENMLAFVRLQRESDSAAESAQLPDHRAMNAWRQENMAEQLEIGMPLTGLTNLQENGLLKYLGDLRWRHITKLTGTSSKDLVDHDGARLYPAFFYVDVRFPPAQPMASFGENDKLEVVDTVARYGSSILDGTAYLLSPQQQSTMKLPPRSLSDAIAQGIPAVRMSNVFVMQFNGAEWLKKSRPREELISGIPSLTDPPDSIETSQAAEKAGYFEAPGPQHRPLLSVPDRFEYGMNPDRDVNGAGLVYFANYPLFLDFAERAALQSGNPPFTEEQINRRTLITRKIAYFNNASWKDSVTIQTRTWLENAVSDDPDAAVRLLTHQTMRRSSDGRTMCIATAQKTFCGLSLGDLQ